MIFKAKYVICMPGTPSSGEQMTYVMQAYTTLNCRGDITAFRNTRGSYVYGVRNEAIKGGRIVNGKLTKGYWKYQLPFENELDYEWIVWIDSDNFIDLEMIARLIGHDVDICGSVYRAQIRPLGPDNHVACGMFAGLNWDQHIPYTVSNIVDAPKNDKGLVPVDFLGFGLTVVRKGVFESMTYPWFRHYPVDWVNEEGEECCEVMSEDVDFCIRAKQAGFQAYIDPEIWLLHEKKIPC